MKTNKLFVICMLAAAFSVIVSCGKQQKDAEIAPMTYEQASAEFMKMFPVHEDWNKPFEVYPSNRLYVDIFNKTICFEETDDKITKWKYSSVSGTLKKLDGEYGAFADWITQWFRLSEVSYSAMSEKVDVLEKYKTVIAGSSLHEEDKILSLIYNSLVADPQNGYISASIDSEGGLVKSRYPDYGKYVFNKNRFTAAMNALKSAEKQIDVMTARKFLEDNGIIAKAQVPRFCYWNYREDNFYIYPAEKLSFKLEGSAPSIHSSLKQHVEMIKGSPDKVFYASGDGENFSLEDLGMLYRDSLICLNLNLEALSGCAYVSPAEPVKESENRLLVIILIAVGVVIVLVLGALAFIFRESIKKLFKRRGNQHQRFVKTMSELARNKNLSPEEVLKTFDEEFGVRTADNYAKMNSKAVSYDTIAKIYSDKVSVEVMLDAVDGIFAEHQPGYRHALDVLIRKMGDYVTLYKEFLALKSENAVMEFLDRIRTENPSFPDVKTVARMVAHLHAKSEDPQELIKNIIDESDPTLAVAYSNLLRDSASYKYIGTLFRNETEGIRTDQYLSRLIDYLAMDDRPVIDKYIDFALNFKPVDQERDDQMTNAAKSVRDKYASVDEAVDALVESVAADMDKDALDYWDRLTLLLSLTSCAKTVFAAYGRDYAGKIDVAVEMFKMDMLYLYVTRNFIAVSRKEDVSHEAFKADIIDTRIVEKVNSFNTTNALEHALDLSHVTLQECMAQCVEAIRKIRKEEVLSATFDKMWERFVKDFSSGLSSDSDKGWVISNSIQIAVYFTDILKHYVGGMEMEYCKNLHYLITDALADCDKDYVENHMTNSDSFSNYVYSILKENGAAGIDMLAGNFRIKI